MQAYRLFSIEILHNYYQQSCPDFRFIIPADSAETLKNSKMLTRVSPGRLDVLRTSLPEQDSFGLAGKTLRFGLMLLNPFFNNFTNTEFDLNLYRPLYRNEINSEILTLQPVTLVGKIFNHAYTKVSRPMTVVLQDPLGRTISNDTITAIQQQSYITYDLSGTISGKYVIKESNSSSTKKKDYYCDHELQTQGVFGFVEIKMTDDFKLTPPKFTISFAAKQEIIKYYVIANNYTDSEFKTLSIADGGEESRGAISFLPAALTPEDLSPSILIGDKNARVALFKSQSTVAWQEKARQKIQLKKNGDVLIANLPQPRIDRANTDVIVQISKPKT
jgi:hypothetical protein